MILSPSLTTVYLVVGLQVAGIRRRSAGGLDGREHVVLLIEHRVAQVLTPGDVVAHLLDDFGVVDEGEHGGVPFLVRLQVRILRALLQEALGLDDLYRIGRGGKNDGQQLVGIEGDGRYQGVEFLGGEQCPAAGGIARSGRLLGCRVGELSFGVMARQSHEQEQQ